MSVAYTERLRVPPWWWLVVLFLVLSAAVAVFAYAPVPVGIAITLMFLVVLGGILIGYGRLGIEVDDQSLLVGRNRLGGHWIADVEPLEGVDAAGAMGTGAGRRDFLVTRPYIRGVVRVRLDDPADPHPHWVISTRRPDELAEAIRGIVGVA